MSKLIITTEEELRQILNDCLSKSNQVPILDSEANSANYLYSIKELAKFLGCSTVTAQNIKNSRKIRYVQIGRKLLFNTAHIMEDLQKDGRSINE